MHGCVAQHGSSIKSLAHCGEGMAGGITARQPSIYGAWLFDVGGRDINRRGVIFIGGIHSVGDNGCGLQDKTLRRRGVTAPWRHGAKKQLANHETWRLLRGGIGCVCAA